MKYIDLNHVALHVADVERSCAFYAEVLGLKPLPRPAFSFPGAWFRLGAEQELHLIGDREQPVASNPRGGHFALQVASIRDAEAELKDKGAQFKGPQHRPDGAWQIFITDPDGNWIELCELPTL